MDRSRSRRNIFQTLAATDSEQGKDLDKLASKDRSIPDWIEIGAAGAPAFLHGWVQYNSNDATYAHSGFYRNPAGMVVMRGLISSGTVGQSAFTLPVGFRPKRAIIFDVTSADAFGSMRIFADGTVVPTVGSPTWFSIECVFRAEQ